VIIHRYLLDRKIVIPQRKVQTNTGSGIVGAYIKDPLVGMHGWIVSFDLTSLYPHLIISHNISPDTLKGRLASPFTVDQYVNGAANKVNKFLVDNNFSLAASNYYYDRSKQGFMADLMELFFQQRKQYKDLMLEAKKRFEKTKDPADEAEMAKFDNYQKAAKVKLNSAYGAFGNAYFRWYDKRLAESITMSGQLTIRWAEQKMNAFINEQIGTNDIDYIIAADTDSLYVNMGRLVEHFNWNHFDDNQIARNLDQYCEQIIQPFLNKIYNELGTYMNAHKSVLYMKREAIGNRGIWVAKKRYMINVLNNEGVWYKEPDLKIMGIESVRSSTPKVCRDAIEHLIKIIMTTDEATTQQEIENFRKQYYQLPFEDIAFPRGLNGLTKYADSANVFASGCPIHVRGALSYNHFISKIKGKRPPEVRDREKVKWCYLKVPNPIGQNVIAVPQVLPRSLGLDKYIDYPLMFERTYLDAVNNILGKIGWEAEKQYKMRNFFE
jgi:DNA polymerase elongation subunit (family B)